MSNRSLIEINHDYTPRDDELLAWAKAIQHYLHAGSECHTPLPEGVTLKWRRHHSDPCPFDQPLEFERRHPRSKGQNA